MLSAHVSVIGQETGSTLPPPEMMFAKVVPRNPDNIDRHWHLHRRDR